MKKNRLFKATAVSILATGAICSSATVAQAEQMQIINKHGASFWLVYAEPDSTCASGLREHRVTVNSKETKNINANTSGTFLLAAAVIVGYVPSAIVPKTALNTQDWWMPNGDEENACAEVGWGGGNTTTRAFWFASYNLSNACEGGGVLGIELTDEERPRVGVVCWVNGPDGEPQGTDEGVSPG